MIIFIDESAKEEAKTPKLSRETSSVPRSVPRRACPVVGISNNNYVGLTRIRLLKPYDSQRDVGR